MAKSIPVFPAAALLAVLVAALPGCACPGCPADSVDGPGLALQSPPTTAERGALGSALDVIAATEGPESPVVRAFDAALGMRGVVIGRLAPAPGQERVFGYLLLKDGRLALDDRYARGTPPDSGFLARPAAWRLIPIVYAAGYRLNAGGTWADSIAAAGEFARRTAGPLRSGRLNDLLPKGANRNRLAEILESWPDAR